ncbi:class I heat shock protein, putative (DUF1423) [Wolffia australiana]
MFLEGNRLRRGPENADRGSTTPVKAAEKKAHTSQELTLSYLCENPQRQPDAADNLAGKNKETVPDEPPRWMERDFLQLSGGGGATRPKREPENGSDWGEKLGKKAKPETLNLSLSLDSCNPLPSNTRASSEDWGASFSYHSNPFSHNPSCSLTRNSTENLDYSRETDQREGTNGSVHSRFKPVQHKGDSSSFFPAELPARPRETQRSSQGKKTPGLKEIVLDPVPLAAQRLNEAGPDQAEGIRNQLRSEVTSAENKELVSRLQRRLERRADLTPGALMKANQIQLEAMVAVKFSQPAFLSGKVSAPVPELAEILLESRCKNINCRSALPVDDCDCEICVKNKGFCSACMCPVCLTFDCAQNTCGWVGCDVCSHWCHAGCGIKRGLIRPGVCGGDGRRTEMQFYCVGCGHTAEMFGFVKDVFVCCAKDWGGETLGRELDCVRMIFKGSEDARGRQLCALAEQMVGLLQKKLVSPSEACNRMVKFLKDGRPSEQPPKDKEVAGWVKREEAKAEASPSGQTRGADTGKKGSVAESEPSIKEGEDSLDSIVRFKLAEAELFQRLADEARKEVEGYRRIAQGKSEKLEAEYAGKVAKLCLREAEERRRKKLDELKRLENSHYDYHNMKMKMQAEISGLLERMEATKQHWVRL